MSWDLGSCFTGRWRHIRLLSKMTYGKCSEYQQRLRNGVLEESDGTHHTFLNNLELSTNSQGPSKSSHDCFTMLQILASAMRLYICFEQQSECYLVGLVYFVCFRTVGMRYGLFFNSFILFFGTIGPCSSVYGRISPLRANRESTK